MLLKLLSFRIVQFWRVLKSIGVVYLLLLLIVCTGFFLGLVEAVLQAESVLPAVFGWMILFSIHFTRADSDFLGLLGLRKQYLYSLEYLLVSLPFCLLFLISQNFAALLVLDVGALVIAQLPTLALRSEQMANRFDFKILPKDAFELRSFLRKNLLYLGPFYLGGILGSTYTVVPITMVILMAMAFVSLFDEIEGKALFEAVHFNSGILKRKVLLYLGIFHALLLPYTVLFLIFHLEHWYIILAVLFVCSTSVVFNILYKYAHYDPHRKRVYNSMASSIFFGFSLIPFLYPVTIFYLFFYWNKARKNLKRYYAVT